MIKMESFEGSSGQERERSDVEKGLEVEVLKKEFEKTALQIKEMEDHGSEVDFVEMMEIGKNHPDLIDFFADGLDVLENCNKERLWFLQDRFLTGKITDSEPDSELRGLIDNYFIPFLYKRKK